MSRGLSPFRLTLSREPVCLSQNLHYRASDKCQREKRKTINGDDLIWAMSTLGFEEYVEPLKVYLHKFREVRSSHPMSCQGQHELLSLYLTFYYSMPSTVTCPSNLCQLRSGLGTSLY